MYYIVAIIVAFLLLNLPFVHKSGINVDPIDSLFVAVSGVSVTGLSPVNIVDDYSKYRWYWRHGHWYDAMGVFRKTYWHA